MGEIMDIIGSINTRFLSKSEQSKNEIFNKIDNIVKGGGNIIRMNLSHGKHRDVECCIDYIRSNHKNVKILLDLQGNKIRVANNIYGTFKVNSGDSVKWDENKCKNCGLCLEKCKNNCGPRNKYMSVGEIIKEILKTKPFISGITVSGGECTLQKDFLIDLFEKIKLLGLTIFIDTNGSLDFSKNPKLTELMDMAMVDVKSFDNEEHKMLTKRNNDIVLKNVRYLASINKLYEIRTVIVPDLLDNKNNVFEISKLIASLNPNIRYKLIKYRPMGIRKEKIESKIPTNEYMENLKNMALKNGCKNIIIL